MNGHTYIILYFTYITCFTYFTNITYNTNNNNNVGGMYLENATSFLPNLAKFYQSGAVTTRARDQMPSVSAPNWCTIITGQGPEESGVPQNGWVPLDDNPPNPSSFELPPISGAGKVLCYDIVQRI